MFYKIFLMIIGFVFLVKGADFIIKGATNIAKKLHLSEVLIGILIVGIGTSLPELIITIQSTITGNPDIIIGNSIGSCICNLLLVTGIASVCNPIKIDDSLLRIHLPVSGFTIIILTIFCNFGNGKYIISRKEGVFLLIFASIYIIYTMYNEKKKSKKDENDLPNEGIVKSILFLLLGGLGLKYGADFVVDGAVLIAKNFGVSESVISITIVALGTSLPEIVTAIIATLKNESDLALGNVVGSNIFNICLLPGVGACIKPINYKYEFNKSLIFLLIITTYLLVFDLFQNKRTISRYNGVVLVLLFCLYVSCLF